MKVWDAVGNVTEERKVDASKADTNHCDYLDMYADSCPLTDSGEFPDAQSTFIKTSANLHGSGTVYDSPIDKMN